MDRSHLPQVLAIERACFSKPWSEQTFADELYNDAVSLVVAEGEDGAVLGYGEGGPSGVSHPGGAGVQRPSHRPLREDGL